MDEWITWAINNKEWVLSTVCAVAAGLFVLVKWLFKKPPQATVSNTASTGGIAGQTINPQASAGGVAFVSTGTVNIGAPFDASPIVDKLLLVQGEKVELEKSVTSLRQQLEEAVVGLDAIRQEKNSSDSQSDINQALEQLSLGKPEEAESIFQALVNRKEPDIRKTAEVYRHIGALAYLHDPQKAIDAYRRSTELDPENSDGWNRYGLLSVSGGELLSAENAHNQVLRLGKARGDDELLAVAYGNLGIVHEIRGDLDQAEGMYKKALAIDKTLGCREGMANGYGSLGIIYKNRAGLAQIETEVCCYLDEAKKRSRKALKIFKELRDKGGMARTYSNLGNVYIKYAGLSKVEAKFRRYINLAEAMYRKSLGINEILGRKEDMAIDYGNLGTVYHTCSGLDEAEAMYRISLGISETLGHKEGMARQYGNLGNVYKTRGELDQTEEFYRKSIALFREIGAGVMAEQVQGCLNALAKEKDNLT